MYVLERGLMRILKLRTNDNFIYVLEKVLMRIITVKFFNNLKMEYMYLWSKEYFK